MSKNFCTPKQAAILKKRGLPVNVTFDVASATIDKIAKQEGWGKPKPVSDSGKKANSRGPATIGQTTVLTRFNYDTDGLTFQEASVLLDALKKNAWKRPDYDEELDDDGATHDINDEVPDFRVS